MVNHVQHYHLPFIPNRDNDRHNLGVFPVSQLLPTAFGLRTGKPRKGAKANGLVCRSQEHHVGRTTFRPPKQHNQQPMKTKYPKFKFVSTPFFIFPTNFVRIKKIAKT